MNGQVDAFDRRCLQRAIEIGRRGWGRVHPNPMVGAVIARDGRILAEGWHEEYGSPHAEIVALARVPDAAGATLYASLEPCAHRGKTPPCTEAIARAGIARVVYWAAEPGSCEGGGGEWLRRQGLRVMGPVGSEAAWRAENPFFFHAVPSFPAQEKSASVNEERAWRPYLALKLAMSLDGCIAPPKGRNVRLTGPAAHAEVHRLRAGFDALLVGSRTWEADDPQLTVRGAVTPRTPPRRIILDRRGRAHPELRVFRSKGGPRPVVATAPARAAMLRRRLGAQVRIVAVAEEHGRLNLRALLQALLPLGMRTLLCEGGGILAGALLAAGLVDRLYLFTAPLLIGAGGVPAFPAGTPLGEGWRPRLDPVKFEDDTLVVLDRDRAAPLR